MRERWVRGRIHAAVGRGGAYVRGTGSRYGRTRMSMSVDSRSRRCRVLRAALLQNALTARQTPNTALQQLAY